MSVIGKKISKIYSLSSFIDGELSKEIVAVYCLIEHNWWKIVVEDGYTSIMKEEHSPQNFEWTIDETRFHFLLTLVDSIDLTQLGEIVKVSEILYKGQTYESCGVIFKFENGLNWGIIEKNDSLEFKWSKENLNVKDCTIHIFSM